MSDKTLNLKQKAFCEHYAACLNGAKAAILAGYSERSAKETASEILTYPNVKAYIKQLLEEKTLRREEILARLSSQASFDIADITDINGNVDFEIARQNGLTHVIKSIKRKVDKSGEETIEYELYDAQAALVHLGRAYSLFSEKLEVSGKVEGELTDLSGLTFEQLFELKHGRKPD